MQVNETGEGVGICAHVIVAEVKYMRCKVEHRRPAGWRPFPLMRLSHQRTICVTPWGTDSASTRTAVGVLKTIQAGVGERRKVPGCQLREEAETLTLTHEVPYS